MPRRLTSDQFIERAIEVHGDRYDYSRVEYINSGEKVQIGCEEHGWFWQRANSHLKAYGCPDCGRQYQQRHKLTTEEFIERAIKIHGDRYDYSRVEYIDSVEKVQIGCEEHGRFYQTPRNHIQGNGCPACARQGRRLTTEEFIGKAIEVHGNRYDYSRLEYINSRTKVQIGCEEHGYFWQRPNDHLGEQGCPACANTGPSHEEVRIMDRLNELGWSFEFEKPIPNTRRHLDFWLPELYLAIEYDGIQHFTGWGGKEENLRKKQAADRWKNQWAEQYEIPLERISCYDNVIERLDEIIAEALYYENC